MPRIRFGADGWRARVGVDFSEYSLVQIADAAGRTWASANPGATVYVAYDTREHADDYACLVGEVLAVYGLRACVSDRPVPLPALSWALASSPVACGGLMLTAGRQPAGYYGIKLRDDEGAPDTGALSRRISSALGWSPTEERGTIELVDMLGPYLGSITSFVNADLIRSVRPRVVVDALYGSAQSCAAELLGRIGTYAQEVHPVPDPSFNGLTPDPVYPWIAEAQKLCASGGVWAGFVFDGDADRFAAIDEAGTYISPNLLLPLLMEHLVLDLGEGGRVVTSSAASGLIARQAKRLGLPLTVVPTGYNWIYGEMERGDVLIGGEESGTVGVPAHMLERDPLLGAALICQAMAARGRTLAQLVADLEATLGHMEYARVDEPLDAVSTSLLENILPGLNPSLVAGRRPASVDHADGLRVTLDDGSWVLVRPSGTDLVVRVCAEAESIAQRDALLSWGRDVVHSAW